MLSYSTASVRHVARRTRHDHIHLEQLLAKQSGLADLGLMNEDVYICLLQVADLSLPIALCEPVTDMQRRGDFLEYVELLHEVSLN